jgi:citrate lyase subunit beta/citryl-CoA lyase
MRNFPISFHSLLFIPASDERKLAKVQTVKCDAVIFDLEDSVASDSKESARQMLKFWLTQVPEGIFRIVRVNSNECDLIKDLNACMSENLDAVMLPKVESRRSIESLSKILGELEVAESLPHNKIKVFPLIESARGVEAANEIALSIPGRLVTLCFGPADLAHDLNLKTTFSRSALLYSRSRIIVAAAAAGLIPAIDGPYALVSDLEGLAGDSKESRETGFQGRLVLHPKHIPIVNRAYSYYSPDEITKAKQIVLQFKESQRMGVGVIKIGDSVIDEPIYLQYLRIVQSTDSHEVASSAMGGS